MISSEGLKKLDDTELFVHCDCEECSSASACSCQGPSELVDENGRKVFAYTEDVSGCAIQTCQMFVFGRLTIVLQRLFTFDVPPGVEVIECNLVSALSY